MGISKNTSQKHKINKYLYQKITPNVLIDIRDLSSTFYKKNCRYTGVTINAEMNKLFRIIILITIFQSCNENKIADAVILSGVTKNNILDLHLKTNLSLTQNLKNLIINFWSKQTIL